MSSKRRPRLADVARLAGVSEATVSVVLNNRVGESVRVSEQTQQKIRDAVRKLGYVPNPLAQSLAGGKNHIIAVFTFDTVFPINHRNFYYPFLIGIEEEAARQGYDLLLVTSRTSDEKRRIFTNGVNRLQLADGAVLLGYESKAELQRLLAEKFPFVYVGRREIPGYEISYAAADYTAAVAEITDYMFEHGHRCISYVQSDRHSESSIDRRLGYFLAHERAGIKRDDCWMLEGGVHKLTAAALEQMLSRGATAFLAEDDILGHRLLDLAAELGLNCPADFSLAVLGDPLSLFDPRRSWTSFQIPRREMGMQAVQILTQRLSNPESEPQQVTLPCTFVPGNTVARPPGHGT